METQTHLLVLEELLSEILARLPLRSLSRFKAVSKTWKSTIESAYFRRLFLSVHRNSSSSWSLMQGAKELIGFHGCETWDLPKSPASLIPPSFQRYHLGDCTFADSSSGLVLLKDGADKAYCYVGNPVLQQWLKIPPPPSDSSVFGLVTRLDEDGVVSGFKVVRIVKIDTTNNYLSCSLSVFLYSSETGIWTSKVIHCPHQITNMSQINLNGTIYFGCVSVPGVLVAHDFYSESDQFRAVQLPDYTGVDNNGDFRRTLTISGGFIMYVRALAQKEENVLKVWRLNSVNDDDSWQLLWEISLSIVGKHAPMAMHPFDNATVYLWSQQDHHLVSCNLGTQNCTIYRDGHHQDCFIDQLHCDEIVDQLWDPRSASDLGFYFRVSIWFVPFVLPRWMEPVPRPPEVEMIDTSSLLSHAASTHAIMMRNMRNRNMGNDDYFWM